ncbi:hypothetical protein MPK9_00063 [Pseudomonas phage MPK9]
MSMEMNKALDLLREIRPSIPKEVLELWCKDRDAFLASHPAVEQAGGDERAVDGKPRATKCPDCGEGDLMPGDLCACGYETDPAAGYACSECDGSGDGYVGEVCRECDGSGWFVTPEQARAALAQPSPAQAEAEQPEIVAFRYRCTNAEGEPLPGWFYSDGAGTLGLREPLMAVSQHERIIGAMRAVVTQLRQHKNDYMDAGQETYRALQNEIREREAEIARLDGLVSGRTAERDAALAQPSPMRCLACGGYHGNSGLPCPNMRVTAQAQPSPTLPPFAEKVLAKLRRFNECAEDSDSGGVDIGRHWLDLLTQLGLLNRVQRSPALWEISQQGEDLLGLDVPEIEVPDSMIEKAWQRFERTLQQLETPGQAEQAEQAEAERPEVVARVDGTDEDWFIQPEDETELHNEGLLFAGCELGRMIDFDRIVGALRAENAKLSEALDECDGDRWKLRSERDAANARLHEVATACATAEQERDATLARVAELEQKSAGSWTVDTSCGRPILMYEGCSVIEDQTAYEVIRMIKWIGELERQERPEVPDE